MRYDTYKKLRSIVRGKRGESFANYMDRVVREIDGISKFDIY